MTLRVSRTLLADTVINILTLRVSRTPIADTVINILTLRVGRTLLADTVMNILTLRVSRTPLADILTLRVSQSRTPNDTECQNVYNKNQFINFLMTRSVKMFIKQLFHP